MTQPIPEYLPVSATPPEIISLDDQDVSLIVPDPVVVAPKIRTIIYVLTLVAGALATAATSITAVLWPDYVGAVTAITGGITGVFATVCGGLGVAYRPTQL
jgi:hypothetical protein